MFWEKCLHTPQFDKHGLYQSTIAQFKRWGANSSFFFQALTIGFVRWSSFFADDPLAFGRTTRTTRAVKTRCWLPLSEAFKAEARGRPTRGTGRIQIEVRTA